jgi:hypothetical protein
MMSYRIRIVTATAALTAALFLAAPSPSHAAGRPWGLPVAGTWERAWSWLHGLLEGGALRKPGAQTKEGAMINPNGSPAPLSPPSTSPQAEEGSESCGNR